MLQTIPQLPPGVVVPYAASSIPDGWLECTGQAVSRTTYKRLFDLIGTTFGAGDGSTTFNVPDVRSRCPVGAGQGSGLTNRTLGNTGGEETHTLITSEMASHKHTFGGGAFNGNVWVNETSGVNLALGGAFANVRAMDTTGGDGAHNNMQPWLALTFIIKT